ncbi:MAG TPA: hypothetical protein VH113_02195, partial [Gemmatimonadales bacterium]|nr:hypothetical protein [Gemmatimonadales bacterium]
MQRTRTRWRRVVTGALALGTLPLVTSVALGGTSAAGAAVRAGGTTQQIVLGNTGNGGAGGDPTSCQLGNGVKHVIDLTFDNVHFFRDNPNVPSDLEMMPNLLNFIEQNGTMLS